MHTFQSTVLSIFYLAGAIHVKIKWSKVQKILELPFKEIAGNFKKH